MMNNSPSSKQGDYEQWSCQDADLTSPVTGVLSGSKK